VRARDGTCRMPGLHDPAHRCQLDHVTPFPHGPTEPANLACLCTTHHGFKLHTGGERCGNRETSGTVAAT